MRGEEDAVRDLAEVAERLRLVRQARRKFLKMWAIDQALVEPLVDRLAADLTADGLSGLPEYEGPVHDTPPAADKG
jgi:hypothetical protein